jgi:6,7-dimethyl-8-ribityllumazine synthase
MPVLEGTESADDRFAIVVSRYHDFVTARLEAGALAAFATSGIPAEHVTIVRVPGAFELPIAARLAAQSRRFAAIVCLGCLVRGATPHFDVVATAVASGLTAAAGDSGVPITFGVLTTNSVEEALERAAEGPSNKGWEAAAAAIEMAGIARALGAPRT